MSGGDRFGRLTVLEMLRGGASGPLHRKATGAMARCRCSCGAEITVRAVELRCGSRFTCSGKHPCSVCGKGIHPRGIALHMRKFHGAPDYVRFAGGEKALKSEAVT